VRHLQPAAAGLLVLALASGCSSRSGLEAAYYKCVSTFGADLTAAGRNPGLGPAEEYLALDAGVLTVTTPLSREPGVGVVGANEAVLCVMDELDAPDDVRREAAAGSSDGSGAWRDYTADWKHPSRISLALEVREE